MEVNSIANSEPFLLGEYMVRYLKASDYGIFYWLIKIAPWKDDLVGKVLAPQA